MTANPFEVIQEAHGTVVLDGGLATELERRGADLRDPLWSAKVLVEDPDAIRAVHEAYFDTICVEVENWALPRLIDAARVRNINLRQVSPTRICVALDETVTLGDVAA